MKETKKVKFSVNVNNCDVTDLKEFFVFINTMVSDFGCEYKKEQEGDTIYIFEVEQE
jgi:hypothetical protein